jgi:ATP-citrate lyase beta-subunit
MAQRAIREYDGKRILVKYLPEFSGGNVKIDSDYVQVNKETDIDEIEKIYPWLSKKRLVIKPDQIIGKRGKNNLILLNAELQDVKKWIKHNMGETITIGGITGELNTFIIEPFIPKNDEYYVAIKSEPTSDIILFSTKGGVNVEENWEFNKQIGIPIGEDASKIDIEGMLADVPKERVEPIISFIHALFKLYVDLHFTFLEINPFTFQDNSIVPLDLKAKVDGTANFVVGKKWGDIKFPEPFGQKLSNEEMFVRELDSKTGASLKLTVLNPEGRIWTMIAGGGASVIFADTICNLGCSKDLANYGEYSGDPSEEFTYLYAKAIMSLMTKKKNAKGKIFIIGGGISNFTDVACTFKGIIKAIREFAIKFREQDIKIFVRRGGPNYKEGLKDIQETCDELGIPVKVYGPDLHMTKIVSIAINGGN